MAHLWEEFFSFASADAQAMVEAGEYAFWTDKVSAVSKTCDSKRMKLNLTCAGTAGQFSSRGLSSKTLNSC